MKNSSGEENSDRLPSDRTGGRETKIKVRRVYLYDAIAVICFGLAGYVVSVDHELTLFSVALLAMMFFFTVLGIRLRLRNHGAKHSRSNLAAICILVPGWALCGFLAWWQIGRAPFVTPRSIRLYAGGSQEHTLVEVRNPNDYPVYSVSLQIIVKGTQSETISIESEKPDPMLDIPVDETVTTSPDTIRFNGAIRSNEAVMVRFFTIAAKSSRRLNVSGTKLVESSANLSVTDWKKVPDVMFSGPNGAGTGPFRFPNMGIRSVQVRMTAAKKPSEVSVYVGNALTTLPLDLGQRKTNATGLVLYLQNDELGIDATLFLGIPNHTSSMHSSEFRFPESYQQNKNAKAVEVVDQNQHVVFQTTQSPGRVQIYAMIASPGGVWVADVDGNRFVDLAHQGELTNGLQVKRIFKYPAEKYPGVIDNDLIRRHKDSTPK